MNCFVHEQCPSEIPSTLLRNPRIQLLRYRPSFLLPTPLKYVADLTLRRRRNPHKKCPTSNGRNYIRRAIRQQYQSQIGTVFLHSSSQCCLRISCQVVRLVDHHDLEPLLCGLVDLLSLSDFLQQILYNDPVIVAYIRWRDFEMVDRGYDIEFEFAIRRGLKDSRIDFDLLHTGTVQLFESRYNASLFARARRAIDKEVRKVARLCLLAVSKICDRLRTANVREIGGVLRDLCGKSTDRVTVVYVCPQVMPYCQSCQSRAGVDSLQGNLKDRDGRRD